MKFLRNPEIQKSLLWHLFLAVLAGCIGFLHSFITGLYLLIFGTLYTFLLLDHLAALSTPAAVKFGIRYHAPQQYSCTI